MGFFDDLFFFSVGYFSEIRNKIEDLVKKGKISQEEAQKMFDNSESDQKFREHLTPLSMSVGFSVYMNKKAKELLEDLRENGKITSDEAIRYYEQYIPEPLKKTFVPSKNEYVTKDEWKKMLLKIDSINDLISTDKKTKGEDAK